MQGFVTINICCLFLWQQRKEKFWVCWFYWFTFSKLTIVNENEKVRTVYFICTLDFLLSPTFVSVRQYVKQSICRSFHMSAKLSICLPSIYQSICPSVCSSIRSQTVHLSVRQYISQSVHLSVRHYAVKLSICLSISVNLSVCQYVSLSVRLKIHQSICPSF